ncbi:MAG: site-specific integrase [Candidatus Thermoplasmatota archaeon]|nr:site-specific integrase [Candidatus Thermoplasmatota archaeon]
MKWAETTYKERERKYRYLMGVFDQLRDEGNEHMFSTKKFGEPEVFAFETWMIKQGLDPRTKKKYRAMVNDLLIWNGNYAYDQLLQRGDIVNTVPDKEIKTISNQDFQKLLKHGKQDRNTWDGQLGYFMVAMYGYCALRNKELRLANLEDIDTKNWVYTVRHPKGEGKYGKQRSIPIVQPLRPIVQEYLVQRKAHLLRHGIEDAKPLIPSITKKNGILEVSFYSDNKLRTIARNMSATSGVQFQIKTLRASCAQILKDQGLPIETISKFLGHSNTKTTEKFYARIRDEQMFKDINNLYRQPEEPDNKYSLIYV